LWCETVQEVVQGKDKKNRPKTVDCKAQIQEIKTGTTSVPDSWCAAHIKCGGFSTFGPFRETAIFRLSLIRIRATSVDLRRVRLDAKTVWVAAAHDVAAAKVRVAQKPCQLHPGWKGPATKMGGTHVAISKDGRWMERKPACTAKEQRRNKKQGKTKS
jgi:hypothetical protein